MKRFILALFLLFLIGFPAAAQPADALHVGFGETDVTPDPAKKPIYLAGFGKNRVATKVHDPLMARAVVLAHDKQKVAIVSVDVVGLFNDVAQRVRAQLPGYTYILVSSTHNHEGPDTLGLWGPNLLTSGVDADYMKQVEAGIVTAIQQADKAKQPSQAQIGTANAPELLHDGREPYVKHDELVALRFGVGKQTTGIVVQWNCHPETLSSKNTEVSADYVGYTVNYLKNQYRCPVVYLTGTVGGLMTSLHVEVKDDQGKPLADGTFAKTERLGLLLGAAADKALANAKPVTLTPIMARTKACYLPIDNVLYAGMFNLGIMKRDAFVWKGDPYKANKVDAMTDKTARLCIQSEVGWLKLGDLEVAAIPGEIYPELVLSKVQDPPDAGADYPDAAVEPGIYAQMKSKYRMIVGLANDEIGYILPKRQWDVKAPYCYGRKKAQYGEENSLGVETGPILCEVFRAMMQAKAVRVRMQTELGDIELELDAEKAPATVANFLRYVDAKLYDGGRFHRTVTPGNQPDNKIKIEVIQAGIRPDKAKNEFPPIKLERTRDTKLSHKDGTISMARDGPDTATGDFFICIGAQPELDFGGKRNPDSQGFAAFGQVVKGMDIVRKIQAASAKGQALTPAVKILTVTRGN
jgi:cyclophilin family peptidyl-prolyl cis-trans isomerase